MLLFPTQMNYHNAYYVEEQPSTREEQMIEALDRKVQTRDDPPSYYSAKATFFPEACRVFVKWWLKTFAFPTRDLWGAQKVEKWLMVGKSFVLIDARRMDEYEASHIYGAIRISPFAEEFPELAGVSPSCKIVCYCAIGLRSGMLAWKLYRRGFVNARALEGGFYGWVNIGKPIYKGNPPQLCYKVRAQHMFASLALKKGLVDSVKLEKREGSDTVCVQWHEEM